MARNAEKAMTTLARWRQAYVDKAPEKERRPFLASECDDLPSAERWRTQIVREVARKVSQIQNAGLGEFRIRDLNDEINKLLREKGHWEARIKQLGGPDYARTGPRMLDREGREAPGNRGYRYFGAARDLPGVRELFEQEPPPPPRKSRAELMKDIDADYYGYLDDDDGQLVPLERTAERRAVAQHIAAWKAAKQKRAADAAESGASETVADVDMVEEDDEREKEQTDDDDGDDQVCPGVDDPDSVHIVAHVPVPSQEDIEAALVMRKKRELLARYAASALGQEEQEEDAQKKSSEAPTKADT